MLLEVKKVKLFLSRHGLLVVSLIGLYLFATGISWLIFSSKKSSSQTVDGNVSEKRSKINLDMPKTASCPINGEMFTEAEKAIWEARSPILAVIENHLDSRPPSGVGRADVVYEAVAEGGITRFLNVFYCGVSSDDWRIGPIRSARVYFINWTAEYGKKPLFLHVGGANNICSTCPGGVKPAGTVARDVNAFDLLTTLGWRYANGNALDGGTNVGYPIVWRDYERIPGAATEHTFMGSTDKLFEEAERRGFGGRDTNGAAWNQTFVPWKFIDNKPAASPTASTISFEFWSNKPDYNVEWRFNSTNNEYMRFNGGKEHMDMETKTQLSSKNVVIVYVAERGPVDKEGHMFYQNIGKGKALIFQNGEVIEGTWDKAARDSRTKFYDAKGKEVSFVKGKIWIEAVPVGNEIVYN